MKKRRLGSKGAEVSALGLGCMGMSGDRYGRSDEEESKATILAALESGITMLDTADMYGIGHNEELIGKTLKKWDGDVFIATKFGMVRKPGRDELAVCGHPDYVKQAAEESLKRLNRSVIDLYYLHRVDPKVPVEETIGAMSELVIRGKVRYIGISEASASTIQKAHSVHELTAVQTEYSLWARHVEKEILPMARKLGIGFVAYSPLGRGFLTGKLNEKLLGQEGDRRRDFFPRFQGENFLHNQKVLAEFQGIAKRKGVTPAQLALAWVLSQGEDIVPIPGTKQRKYLRENIAAVEISLSEKEKREIETVVSPEKIKGERYPERMMRAVEE